MLKSPPRRKCQSGGSDSASARMCWASTSRRDLSVLLRAGLHVAAVNRQPRFGGRTRGDDDVIAVDVARLKRIHAARGDNRHPCRRELGRHRHHRCAIEQGVVGVRTIDEFGRRPVARAAGRGVEDAEEAVDAGGAEHLLDEDNIGRHRTALELAEDGGPELGYASGRIVRDVPCRDAQARLGRRRRAQDHQHGGHRRATAPQLVQRILLLLRPRGRRCPETPSVAKPPARCNSRDVRD